MPRHALKFAMMAFALSVSVALAQNVPNPIDQSNVSTGLQLNGSNVEATGGVGKEMTAATSMPSANSDCNSWVPGSGIGKTTFTAPASPNKGCKFQIAPGLLGVVVDLNGQVAKLPGVGNHDVPTYWLPGLQENNFYTFEWDGTKWVRGPVTTLLAQSANPLDTQTIIHGQYNFAYDGSTNFTVTMSQGPGGALISSQNHALCSTGLILNKSNTTNSVTNYFYWNHQGANVVTGTANSAGAVLLALTTPIPNVSVGDTVCVHVYGVQGTLGAVGLWPAVVTTDTSHLLLTGSTYDSAYVAGLGDGRARVDYMYASTSAPSGTLQNGVQVNSADNISVYLGTAAINGSHTPTSWQCAVAIGCLKTLAVTANANDLVAGTVGNARGGAGATNGVLAGDGAGNVSQGAASGLAFGSTGAATTAIKDLFLNGNWVENDIASAATTNLTTATGPKIRITGTTNISAFTVTNNSFHLLRFAGVLTITNGPTLVLPGNAPITTAANDTAVMTTDNSGNSRVVSYNRAALTPDVAPLASPTFTGTVTLPDATTCPSSGCTFGAAVAMGNHAISNMANASSNNASGFLLVGGATSATVPTLVPNRAATTTGIGADASGDVSVITGAAENMRFTATTQRFISAPTTGTNADFLCMKADGTILLQASACTISSRRFKNVGDPYLDDAMGVIDRLQAYTFTLKGGSGNRDANAARPQIGLMAEDVAAVEPRCAIYEPDGKTPKSYRQECLIAVLVAGSHELQNEIRVMWIVIGLLGVWSFMLTVLSLRRRY